MLRISLRNGQERPVSNNKAKQKSEEENRMKNAVLMTGLSVAILAGGLTQAMASSDDGKMGKGPRHSFEELDANSDGKITQEEMATHMQSRFEGADADGNGTLSKDELVARMTERQAERIAKYADHMIERHDSDGDGELTMAEMRARHKGGMFKRMDADGDGAVTAEEFKAMRGKHGHGHGKHQKSD